MCSQKATPIKLHRGIQTMSDQKLTNLKAAIDTITHLLDDKSIDEANLLILAKDRLKAKIKALETQPYQSSFSEGKLKQLNRAIINIDIAIGLI